MSKIKLDIDENNIVAGHYSDSRGPVLRSEKIELAKVAVKKGESARAHHHPEEQIVYLLSGKVQMTVGGDTYTLEPGEASYHGPNVTHEMVCLEDATALSFKNLVDPNYGATGEL